MYILSNIHDRQHGLIYEKQSGQSPAIFDLSDRQIADARNSDWNDIKIGDLVCVITSNRTFTTVYVVREKLDSGIKDDDGRAFIIRGDIVGRAIDERNYTFMLNKYEVQHIRLPNNQFCNGFNVANLGTKIDALEVRINKRISELNSQNKETLIICELKKIFNEELEVDTKRNNRNFKTKDENLSKTPEDEPVDQPSRIYPDEISDSETFLEGNVKRVLVNAYERNQDARQKCIEHYGHTCFVCGFDFEKVYGPIAEGFIHVHHLRPLSEVGKEYMVEPEKDLRPVCPNCHAVLHRRSPAFSIEEVRHFLDKGSREKQA
jgi:hypothetical protein